jgi:2-haloacid dehalogenase/putative hydrolase of the HAD superfamily
MHGRMALPKEISFVTFDVYGTLIDWETGAYDAFAKEAEKDGYTLSREELVPLFLEIQQEIKGGSYELYAEVLRRTAVQISRQLGWPLEPSRSGFLPESVKRWPPFKETNTQLDRLAKKYELGLISNIDDKLLGETRRHFKADFDLVVTAQQVRSYKPDPAHFKECERRMGSK